MTSATGHSQALHSSQRLNKACHLYIVVGLAYINSYANILHMSNYQRTGKQSGPFQTQSGPRQAQTNIMTVP